MKNAKDMERAKRVVGAKLLPLLDAKDPRSQQQYTVLSGMLVALNWVVENENGTILGRLMRGEPVFNSRPEEN